MKAFTALTLKGKVHDNHNEINIGSNKIEICIYEHCK